MDAITLPKWTANRRHLPYLPSKGLRFRLPPPDVVSVDAPNARLLYIPTRWQKQHGKSKHTRQKDASLRLVELCMGAKRVTPRASPIACAPHGFLEIDPQSR